MVNLKHNKPSNYDGKRDKFIVRTWLHQVKQDLYLIRVGEVTLLDDATKISFAATFFTSNAATWWFTLVGANNVPDTWINFEAALSQEFVRAHRTQ